ncbi:MAG: translation initiation factor [Planctomycetota bacterium]
MRLFEGTEFFQPQHCERCGDLEDDCQCPPLPEPKVLVDPEKQTARVAIEKRKKGKVVTVVRGLAEKDNDLSHLLTRLKNHCGAGGAVKEDTIEIQGKHLDRVEAFLKQCGYRTRT